MSKLSFADTLGQDKAKSLLLKAFNGGKIGHAYLLQGPSGVGKKDMAKAYAAFINCNGPVDNDSCGICGSCKKITAGNHPDLIEIEAENGVYKISQIRELKKTLSFPPFEGKYRFVLMLDIHESMKRKEVANSLLKILEEPPSDTIFILTAEEASGVLATILSRCQIIPFYSQPYDLIAQKLVESGMSPAEANTLASVSEGSIGAARNLANKEFLVMRKEIVETLSGLNSVKSNTVEIIFEMAEKTAKLKDEINDFFYLLKLWIRDLMIVSALGSNKYIVNHDLMHTYTEEKQRWNLSELFDKLKLIDLSQRMINQNCNKTFVCEVLYRELGK